MTNFEFLFSEVKSICEKYEHIAHMTGANFNIFQILGVQSNEIRHSAFLAELLNVQGSHAQGSKYLDLFLEHLKMNNIVFDFDSKTSKTFVEYHIGEVDNEKKEGGYIDILICDNQNRCIAIENKIYAGDQDYQLKRYYNHLNNQSDSILLYLNLFGGKPSKESYDDLEENRHYRIITYHYDILHWLEKCLKESVNLPIVRETIQQYSTLIKKLTNQTHNHTMDNEIINLIKKSSDNMEVAYRIVECFDKVKQQIRQAFWEQLCLTLQEKGQTVKQKEDEKIISLWVEILEINGNQLCWGAEIENNFYTGFWICGSNGEKIPINGNDEFNKRYRNNLREHNYKIDNSSFLGWKYSRPKLNFKEFNSQDIFSLANPDVLKKMVDKIVMEEALKEIAYFKQEIS